MKEKLAPFIKRVKKNVFSMHGSYLMVDIKPLIVYMHHLLSQKINRLLDNPIRILVIQNYMHSDLENHLSNIPFKEVTIIQAQDRRLQDYLVELKDDYYDFVIITHTEHEKFLNLELKEYLSKCTCSIFIAENNPELISILTV